MGRIGSTVVALSLTVAACAEGTAEAPVATGAVTTPPSSAAAATTGPTTTPPASTVPPPTSTTTTTTSTTAATFECALPADGLHEIVVDGVVRTYLTAGPSTPIGPLPTAVLAHGFASGAEAFAATTGLADLAPDAGVLLVAPQGLGNPAGWEIPNWGTDIAVVAAVLDELAGCIDEERVWIGGHSAGSAFAAAAACGQPERYAGMLLNAALPPPLCAGVTPATLVVHGTADPVVPFDGGGQFGLPAVPDSAVAWAAGAGCPAVPTERRLEPDIAVTEWTGCATGSVVRLSAVEGGGHTWAGRPATGSGPTTLTIDASCLLVTATRDGVVGLADAPGCPGLARTT